MLFTRPQIENSELKRLACYAVKSSQSQGRIYPEKEDMFRPCFQIDRDRIIHSKAFRRLKGKTQVFISHYGDHYRTRLSHSLEVSQISRSLARNLGLNEDLAESIALAHDLGHTPFGHAGESAMNEMMEKFDAHFEHNEQSKRVVEQLEKVYPEFLGLNLTFEAREGLMKHRSSWDNVNKQFASPHLEAEVTDIADEIAYQNHDLDDGLGSNILPWNIVKKISIVKIALDAVQKKYGKIIDQEILKRRMISALIHLMVTDVVINSDKNIQKNKITSSNDLQTCSEKNVTFSPKMKILNNELKSFLWDHLYLHPQIKKQAAKGKKIIQALFNFYVKNPQKIFGKIINNKHLIESIKDHIAGMTDEYAEEEWGKTIKLN